MESDTILSIFLCRNGDKNFKAVENGFLMEIYQNILCRFLFKASQNENLTKSSLFY